MPALRVLITGAAGFLGSHLSERFLADGHAVVGVDSFLTGDARNVAHLAREPRFALLEQDVSAGIVVDGRVDLVLHFASPASPVDYYAHPIATLDVGSAGTRHALVLARRNGARFLLASTSEVYGDPQVHPQPESYWGHVNPIGPRSCYDGAKRFAEAMTMAFHRAEGVDTRIVRIFNTYGPRMRPNDGRVVSNFIVQALRGEPLTVYGAGAQTRSFTYVDDLVEGIVRLATRPRTDESHLPTNIGNPAEFTIAELADLVERLVAPITGVAVGRDRRPMPADDPRQRRPDIARAQATLGGWAARVALHDGLLSTISWFRTALAADAEAAARVLPCDPPDPAVSLTASTFPVAPP
jgi:dTDP-glucose 4,6-dehydratase